MSLIPDDAIFIVMEDVDKVDQAPKKSLLRKFPKSSNKGTLLLAAGSLLVVLAGIATGWLFTGSSVGMKSKALSGVAPGAERSMTEAGITDEELFPDTAEGILEEGGIDGEGTHHLVREGGPSKYLYLTSTVIDLQGFMGKSVMVWGRTLSGQQAGWLMDVGKIKVIE